MYTYNVIIKKIIDGDTVNVDVDLGFDVWMLGQSVRLFGIDTPETRTSDLVEKRFGLMAKEFVEAAMPVNSVQQMVSVKMQRGKFGRILGEFIVNDPQIPNCRYNLNRLLVDKRLAVAYTGDQSRDTLRELHHKNRMYLIENDLTIP